MFFCSLMMDALHQNRFEVENNKATVLYGQAKWLESAVQCCWKSAYRFQIYLKNDNFDELDRFLGTRMELCNLSRAHRKCYGDEKFLDTSSSALINQMLCNKLHGLSWYLHNSWWNEMFRWRTWPETECYTSNLWTRVWTLKLPRIFSRGRYTDGLISLNAGFP